MESLPERKHRFLGTFTLPGGATAVGELRLDGPETLLELHSDDFLPDVDEGACIKGVGYERRDSLTLIDCLQRSTRSSGFDDAPAQYRAEVFPHFVAVGRSHLDPARAYVRSIEFTCDDLASLFYDDRAFGYVVDAKSVIDTALAGSRSRAPMAAGDSPDVFFYTGKGRIADVPTSIGRILAYHRFYERTVGPGGIVIRSRVVVTIEPDRPIRLREMIDRMYAAAFFFSMAAGRIQGISEIFVTTTEMSRGAPASFTIHQSHGWTLADKVGRCRPHPIDVPLDPVRRPEEFSLVLADWMRRHGTWCIARGRLMSCMRNVYVYETERLVAAANMFDLLPAEAAPFDAELPAELKRVRDECKMLVRKLEPGPDRDSLLGAIGRLGKPSLRKKIERRVSVVQSQMGSAFEDLQWVVDTAVDCRNYFVHGTEGKIPYARLEPLIAFLTDALEFVFAASDFIDAGWDAKRWIDSPSGHGHSFGRFRWNYQPSLAALRRAKESSEASD